MAITRSQLEDGERDLRLADRREADPPAGELEVIRERMKTARKLTATHGMHCRDCFQRGRDAVLAHLEGDPRK